MADLSHRRWWPLAEALTTDRLRTMFDVAATETATRAAATQQLAATLAHVVIGRVVPLVVSAATQVPLLAGSSELTQHATRPGGSRRAGRVRVAGARRDSGGRREELAKLGQPCLFF